ncbi:cysteine desulfurase [Peptococcaceae bacterium]|nr:cysteine desulfurase [Peptococcaceae bacterium]
MKEIYFDHAATTPMDKEVAELVFKYTTEYFGNPSSMHNFGQRMRSAVENARKQVAYAIGAKSVGEIVFCSGGTEANNMAILGAARANKQKGNHIITTAVEHHSVLTTCKRLANEGFELTILPVDKYGTVSVQDVVNAVTDKTILVSIMHANNEIGSIMPIAEIGKALKKLSNKIIFHTDAVQSIGKLPVNVDDLNVDILTISAHKIYGPMGVGAMYLRQGTWWQPIMYGGGQERRRRPGTENAPGIIGFGKAIELAMERQKEYVERLTRLRDKLVKMVFDRIPDVILNGHPTNRLPGHVSLCIKYIESEALMLYLNMQGIAVSSGSACTSVSPEPSHVLAAIGVSREDANSAIRITLGKDNTDEEVERFVEALADIVSKLRAMSPVAKGDCSSCACEKCV